MRALANLGEKERREVVAAAERAARERNKHVVASWRSLGAAIGIVRGDPADAVVDTTSSTRAEVVLDANGLVALLYSDDSLHQRAVDLAAGLEAE